MRTDTKKEIFAVDNSATCLDVTEKALEEHYHVKTFSTAEEMFTAMEMNKPDMILLSVFLEGMDGFQAIKLLKANDDYVEIPVIFISSLEDDSEAMGFELGAVDFIRKPYHKQVLLNRIKVHMRMAEKLRG